MILTAAGALMLFAIAVSNSADKLPVITVSAPNHTYHNCALTVALPKRYHNFSSHSIILESSNGLEKLPCQIEKEGSDLYLHFVISELAKGAKKTYQLKNSNELASSVVSVREISGDVEVKISDALFTKYTTHSGPNKPFFYPILTPAGQNLTRRWPIEEIESDSHDHSHHRGLWFTHGNVNGVDFWGETPGTGKTVTTGFRKLVSGSVFGSFETTTDWRTPDGLLMATDLRTVRITKLPNGDRLLDFEIVFQPNGKPVVFGDTKEGMFGLRTTDTLAPSRKHGGHIINSEGQKDGDCWAKKASWVDYFGPVGGEIYGIAIFDTASNLRHPQTWHARDYGLFTINPFGLHDFGMGDKGAGDYIVPAEKTMTLKYRLLFHKGDTEAGGVLSQYDGYSDPPEVKVQ